MSVSTSWLTSPAFRYFFFICNIAKSNMHPWRTPCCAWKVGSSFIFICIKLCLHTNSARFACKKEHISYLIPWTVASISHSQRLCVVYKTQHERHVEPSELFNDGRTLSVLIAWMKFALLVRLNLIIVDMRKVFSKSAHTCNWTSYRTSCWISSHASLDVDMKLRNSRDELSV